MMKNTLFLYGTIGFLLLLLVISIGCNKKTTDAITETSPGVQDQINAIMGKKVTTIANNSNDHILCIKKEGSLLSSFMVLSTDGKVVIKKKKVRGSVAWHSDDAIEVTIIPGVIDKRSNEQPTKTIIPIRQTKEAI